MSRNGALAGRRRDKRAAAIDRYVGSQIRLRRKMLGVSQDCLAAALGVSFQQVQKYETGVSCICAGRLHLIARALKAPVASFFPPPEEDGAAMDALGRSDAIELSLAAMQVVDPKVRRRLVDLVRTIAAASAEAPPPV